MRCIYTTKIRPLEMVVRGQEMIKMPQKIVNFIKTDFLANFYQYHGIVINES